jgi:hypothetical protein
LILDRAVVGGCGNTYILGPVVIRGFDGWSVLAGRGRVLLRLALLVFALVFLTFIVFIPG